MKQRNRIWIYPLIVMGFLLMLAISCKKDENFSEYTGNIEGTYNGTLTLVGMTTVSASSTLTKSSETIVDLTVIIGANSIPLPGINVSSSGSNIYNLSAFGGLFEGKVEGNRLTWTLTAGGSITETFTGIK